MQDLSFDKITKRIKAFNLPHFDLVVGIAEGGKVPAGIIAYKLEADLNIIKISFRDEANTPLYSDPVLIGHKGNQNKKILIVDDVSVTGKTLEKASKLFPGNEVKTLTLKGRQTMSYFLKLRTVLIGRGKSR